MTNRIIKHQDASVLFAQVDLEDPEGCRHRARLALADEIEQEMIENVQSELEKDKLLRFRSWDDAWQFIIPTATLAVRAALRLRAMFAHPRDWSLLGFDEIPRLRCILYMDEVAVISTTDPVTGFAGTKLYGKTCSLAARIAPLSLPQRVWVTRQVAEQIRRDAQGVGLICQPLGELQLAKGWAQEEIFDIRSQDIVELDKADLDQYCGEKSEDEVRGVSEEMKPTSVYEVFISCSEHEEEAGSELGSILSGIGIKVFMASHSVRPGEIWTEEIRKNLHSCSELVAMLTPDSARRPWMNAEMGAAWTLGKTITPVLLAGATATDLPDLIGPRQAVRLEKESGLKLLVEAIVERAEIDWG